MHATVTRRETPLRLAVPPVAGSISSDVGPVYGVKDFLKKLYANYAGSNAVLRAWHEDAKAKTRKSMTVPVMESISQGYRDMLGERCVLSWEQTIGRRLGKPSLKVLAYVAEPVGLHSAPRGDMERSYTEDGVLVRRISMTLSDKRVEYVLSHAHLVINRHGLERLYERERCTLATFDATFRQGVIRMLDAFALVLATRTARVNDGNYGERIDAALPLGNGLIIAGSRTMYQIDEMSSQQRAVIQGGKASERAVPYNKFLAMPTVQGVTPVVASIMLAVRTYMSSRDMSIVKTRYLDIFNDLLDNYDLSDVREAMFAPQLHNETGERDIVWAGGMGDRVRELMALLEGKGILNQSEDAICSIVRFGETREQALEDMVDTGDGTQVDRARRAMRNNQRMRNGQAPCNCRRCATGRG